MLEHEDVTFTVPRFLSFIDLVYLLEGAKVSDGHFASRVNSALAAGDQNVVGNLNATRQALSRAVFIASYAILEQNLDELVEMERKKCGASLLLSDLKDRGIFRSLTYANKVLGRNIDVQRPHWKSVLALQEVRNHLAHYGPTFAGTREHDVRLEKFSVSQYVTLRPAICFTIAQMQNVSDLYMTCVNDFVDTMERSGTA
jgi:hypothetical protein